MRLRSRFVRLYYNFRIFFLHYIHTYTTLYCLAITFIRPCVFGFVYRLYAKQCKQSLLIILLMALSATVSWMFAYVVYIYIYYIVCDDATERCAPRCRLADITIMHELTISWWFELAIIVACCCCFGFVLYDTLWPWSAQLERILYG